MSIHTITAEEKARLTDSACHLFIARNPDFWPCAANSQRLISFVHQQLGQTLDEFPYPVTVDMWQAAFDHIKQTSWLYQRPEEVIDEYPAVVEEARKQQKVRDDYDAKVAADKIARDKAMPLNELSKVVSIQNSDFRAQRDANTLPTRREPGLESRRMSDDRLGIKARARIATGNAHPELAVDSQEFNRLYAIELQRLRNE
jgi:hypothetical protein